MRIKSIVLFVAAWQCFRVVRVMLVYGILSLSIVIFLFVISLSVPSLSLLLVIMCRWLFYAVLES